jgi:hypothetical protein
MYYYIMEEYRVSNELLIEDVYVSANSKDLEVEMRLTNPESASYGTACRELRPSFGRQS